ncbi:Rrf2 family transcriptional regulator [Acidobacteria bacterium Mor1]|nr:Rrf2 family transcriptional regulator [Acidobacteria bacterium Mor1]
MLSQTAEYALRAVSCLAAEAGTPLSADRIAERTAIPRRYLTRVLQALREHRLVGSRSGPGGGYELLEPPGLTTILDVVDAVAPIPRIERCPLGIESHRSLCPLHSAIDVAYEKIRSAFAEVTLAQLVGSKGGRGPLCEERTPRTAGARLRKRK